MMWPASTLPARPGPLPSALPTPSRGQGHGGPSQCRRDQRRLRASPASAPRLTSSMPWGNGLSTQSFSGKRCRIWPWPSPLPEDGSRWSEGPPPPTPTQAGAKRISASHLAAPGGNVPTPPSCGAGPGSARKPVISLKIGLEEPQAATEPRATRGHREEPAVGPCEPVAGGATHRAPRASPGSACPYPTPGPTPTLSTPPARARPPTLPARTAEPRLGHSVPMAPGLLGSVRHGSGHLAARRLARLPGPAASASPGSSEGHGGLTHVVCAWGRLPGPHRPRGRQAQRGAQGRCHWQEGRTWF